MASFKIKITGAVELLIGLGPTVLGRLPYRPKDTAGNNQGLLWTGFDRTGSCKLVKDEIYPELRYIFNTLCGFGIWLLLSPRRIVLVAIFRWIAGNKKIHANSRYLAAKTWVLHY